MNNTFEGIFKGLNVLLTGHTGFKGAWLSTWLIELGARVTGYSLAPPTTPNLFTVCDLENKITHIHGDIRNYEHFHRVVNQTNPDVIIHLAAQPLVLYSYDQPQETFEVNVQGSINVMEAAIQCPSVKAIVMVTTDKVYENREQLEGYRESDRLGGHDPYSASKAMVEIGIDSYRKSFANANNRNIAIASARAGNVIGGGDFSENRLVPDIIKALMKQSPVKVRNPQSVRPWMHVLEPLSGYLWLTKKLLENSNDYSQAWNFAPIDNHPVTCRAIVEKSIEIWGAGSWIDTSSSAALHEMNLLRLNGEKTMNLLGWSPCYSWEQTLEATVDWYKTFYQSPETDMFQFCAEQINAYMTHSKHLNQEWSLVDKISTVGS
ncbi:MAG: CDP-glucose 4,6-dehydratase [Chlamydiota bacterium]|nr:CDP-glucose 4,6-dehydratase [Chlamydiota bacterium]